MTNVNVNSVKNLDADDKILFIIKDVLNACDLDSAVTMEQVIEKGIELGLTKDYITENWEGYKKGDHTWWPKVAAMSGVGTKAELDAHEVPHLHRKKVRKNKVNRKSSVMVYWYDPNHKHTVVLKKDKVNKKVAVIPTIPDRYIEETLEQKQAICDANPGKYMMIGTKRISIEWITNNPEKAKALYGEINL